MLLYVLLSFVDYDVVWNWERDCSDMTKQKVTTRWKDGKTPWKCPKMLPKYPDSSADKHQYDPGKKIFKQVLNSCYLKRDQGFLHLFFFFSFLLLLHEGSHREVYQEFKPSYDIFRWWCQGLFRPQVPCTPNLHCPIANSASTQSQQPV